jgi:glycosyltransferase involved in cell wall biosynthesis
VNPTFFTLADAFIMPSLWEEWGLVVNEALACSTPVIVSANAGCAEDLVIEGETGYKIDPRNIESITTAMSHIGANTSDLQKMGTAGLTIVKQFDCTNFGNNAMSSVEYTNR